jgi:hypothetical protein
MRIEDMSVVSRLLALGASLAVSGALASATSTRVVAQDFQPYSRPASFQIAATCSTELSPDKAVIVGGVSSSALKPIDAVAQLDQQLALMATYVREKHGELQMMERVRSLKNPHPGKADLEPPFQIVQRLHATFPADAPVDAIVQKLIELGMDRFGDNVLNSSNRREPVIRFRFSNFDSRMNDFQQRCTANAWTEWCAAAGSGGHCPSQTPPASLELQGFNVRSKETPLRPDGVSAPWQWSVSRLQRSPEPPDLLGNMTVHLEGNINLTYHGDEEKR